MQKKDTGQKMQFLPNQTDIQAILPFHELVILSKFSQ